MLSVTSWCRKLSESVAEMKQQVRAAQSDGGEALRVAQEEAHMRGEHIDKLKHALGEAAAAGDKFEVENKELRAKVKDLEPKARAMEVCRELRARRVSAYLLHTVFPFHSKYMIASCTRGQATCRSARRLLTLRQVVQNIKQGLQAASVHNSRAASSTQSFRPQSGQSQRTSAWGRVSGSDLSGSPYHAHGQRSGRAGAIDISGTHSGLSGLLSGQLSPVQEPQGAAEESWRAPGDGRDRDTCETEGGVSLRGWQDNDQPEVRPTLKHAFNAWLRVQQSRSRTRRRTCLNSSLFSLFSVCVANDHSPAII